MADTTKIQLLRGLEANRLAQTPDVGELLVATDETRLYLGDGATAGGKLVGAEHMHPGYVTGSRYLMQQVTGAASALNPGTGTIFLSPFFVPRPVAIDELSFEVTTAIAAGTARVGIYAAASGTPGALLIDSGALSCAATGMVSASVAITLRAGWYFSAFAKSSHMTFFRGVASANGISTWLPQPAGQLLVPTGLEALVTYGAFPNPIVAAVRAGSGSPALVAMRVA